MLNRVGHIAYTHRESEYVNMRQGSVHKNVHKMQTQASFFHCNTFIGKVW